QSPLALLQEAAAVLPEAQRVIDQMFNRLVKLAGSGQNRDSIYHVGVQLFRLTEAKPRRKRS
ncbi:MAG: hypothetical protein AAB425_11505, partial [Bdellovibrionota bacterium]